MQSRIKSKIELRLPLTERERAYAILYMGYSVEQLEEIYQNKAGGENEHRAV